MRRILVSVAVLAFASLVNSAPVIAQGLPADFVSAYGAALEVLQRTYTGATIEGTTSQTSPGKKQSIQRKFTLKINGNQSRIDSTVTAQQGTDSTVGTTDIVLATPDASLSGTHGPKARISNNMQEDSYSTARAMVRDLCPFYLAYSFDNQNTILSMLQSSNVKITSFKRGQRDGEPMIQIKYDQQTGPDGRFGPWSCTLLISPAEGYALRVFERTKGTGASTITVSGSLSYSLDPHGVPLVDKIERREEQGPARTLVDRSVLNVSKFNTTPPRDFRFTADAF